MEETCKLGSVVNSYFLKLYQYNAWCNQRVLKCLQSQNVQHEKALTLFSHLLSAQFIWLHRLKALPPPPYELWKKYKLGQLQTMVEESSAAWLDFISSTDSFHRTLKYRNYAGDPFENLVEDIIIHVVNHGTYHRGQIALLLREHGFEPVNTDYITYQRVMSGQLKD